MKTVNTSIKTSVLLPRSEESSSKHSRYSKKVEENPLNPIQEKKRSKSPKKKSIEEGAVSKTQETPISPETDESPKEVFPLKTRVFKRIKKIAHKSRSSSNRTPSFSQMICKPHVKRKCVVLSEILVPSSPSSKKHKAEDMEKHISKKQKNKLRKLVINDESKEEEVLQDPPLTTSQVNISNVEISCCIFTKVHPSSDDDENVFVGTFRDIQFNLEEEQIPDNMILIGKQFKILNQKLNLLLHIQDDGGGKHSVSSLEVDLLLKKQVGRLHEAVSNINRNNEKRVKNQLSTFSDDFNEL
ncbi:unnamed protein product [Lactuca saligna]|uniref:Uncharacterized protein n=1 Tax=Lactuca saligna TaxID=75948 RepID=A0AA35YMP7_LACSI|nr:unnamed protein product [Lactuca saligna]